MNGDGEVNIADVNVVINRINLGEGDQDTLLDLNGDGEVNIADVNTVIDLILRWAFLGRCAEKSNKYQYHHAAHSLV